MSAIELRTGNRSELIEILDKNESNLKIRLGNKEYYLDIVKVEKNIYSVLLGNKSFDIEVVASNKKSTYSVRYICHSYNVEIVDAEMRYMKNRLKTAGEGEENIISCPMPGKITRIMVNTGDDVQAGQVVIIVSAMKMESEYKTGKTGIIKEVLVKEGDVIEANMPLIVLE